MADSGTGDGEPRREAAAEGEGPEQTPAGGGGGPRAAAAPAQGPPTQLEHQLGEALLKGDLDLFRELLDEGARPAVRLKALKYNSCLEYAAARAELAAFVLEVMERGARPQVNDLRPEPLQLAARAGSADAVQALLKHRARVNAADAKGWTALHALMYHFRPEPGYRRCLQLLLGEKKLDVNRATDDGLTAAHVAARRSNREALQLLLAWRGWELELDSRCYGGRSARQAIQLAFPGLLERHPAWRDAAAAPVLADATKEVAAARLMAALRSGDQAGFERLLRCVDAEGAPLVPPDHQFPPPVAGTCLHAACVDPQRGTFAEPLLAAGASATRPKPDSGLTPLQLAAGSLNAAALRALRLRGARAAAADCVLQLAVSAAVDAERRSGADAPLSDAAAALEEVLLLAQLDPHAKDKQNRTAADIAKGTKVGVVLENLLASRTQSLPSSDRNTRACLANDETRAAELDLVARLMKLLDDDCDEGFLAELTGTELRVQRCGDGSPCPPESLAHSGGGVGFALSAQEQGGRSRESTAGPAPLNRLEPPQLVGLLGHAVDHGRALAALGLLAAVGPLACPAQLLPRAAAAPAPARPLLRLLLALAEAAHLSVDATDRKGDSALAVAARRRDWPAAALLLAHGADPARTNVLGRPALPAQALTALLDAGLSAEDYPDNEEYAVVLELSALLGPGPPLTGARELASRLAAGSAPPAALVSWREVAAAVAGDGAEAEERQLEGQLRLLLSCWPFVRSDQACGTGVANCATRVNGRPEVLPLRGAEERGRALQPLQPAGSVGDPAPPGPETDLLYRLSAGQQYHAALAHPLAGALLQLKWLCVKRVFYVNVFLYVAFVLLLNLQVALCVTGEATSAAVVWPLRVLVGLFALLELLQLAASVLAARNGFLVGHFRKTSIWKLTWPPWAPWSRHWGLGILNYVTCKQNLLDWIIIIVAAVIAFSTDDGGEELYIYAVGLSAIDFLFILGRLPSLSQNIEMLKVVCRNYFMFLLSYITLLLAFAHCFYILFFRHQHQEASVSPESDNSSLPFKSLILEPLWKTAVMMTGEFEADGLFKVNTMPLTGVLVFMMFVFFISIVLGNLLIGMTVNDSQAIRDESEILSTKSRIQIVYEIELVLSSLPQCNFLSHWLLGLDWCLFPRKFGDHSRYELRVLPNQNGIIERLPNNTRLQGIKLEQKTLEEALMTVRKQQSNQDEVTLKILYSELRKLQSISNTTYSSNSDLSEREEQ